MQLKFLFVVISLIVHANYYGQTWNQVAHFPGVERDDAFGFVIGSKAYCGSGLQTGWLVSRDMFAFDMETDAWTQVASMPEGMERQYATGFSHAQKDFVFGGVGSTQYFSDLWCYNPDFDSWEMRSAMPSLGRMGAACFVLGDTAYIIGGRTESSLSIDEVWAYSILEDTWTAKTPLPFGSRWRAAAAESESVGYLMFGVDEQSRYKHTLHAYNAVNDTWVELSPFPGEGRSYSAMQVMENDLLVMFGLDSLGNSYNDLWRFSLTNQTWQFLSNIPASARRGGFAFSNAQTLYYTTGINSENQRLKETWKVHHSTTTNNLRDRLGLSIEPNPVEDYLKIIGIQTQGIVTVASITGIIHHTESCDALHNQIPVAQLPRGLYLLNYKNQTSNRTLVFFKTEGAAGNIQLFEALSKHICASIFQKEIVQ